MDSFNSTWRNIETVAFKAMDILRSSIENNRAARHVQALLFLKLIADINEEEPPTAWPTLVPPGKNYKWAAFQSNRSGAYELDQGMHLIESRNWEALGGAFSNICFRDIAKDISNGEEILRRLVEIVSAASFQPWISKNPIALGKNFENLTGTLMEGSSSEWGEFSVPSDVAKIIAKVMNPTIKESILDPVCGSGGLLSTLATHAGLKQGSILGQEWRTTALSMCKMNLFVHGVSAHIEAGDALYSPLRDDSGGLFKADIVVGNPPFGKRINSDLEYARPKLFRRGLKSRARSEYAFVAHMLDVANEDTGRVAVIVPQGALFREDERAIRENFISEGVLAGVILLPPRLFTHTSIAVAILLFIKSRKNRNVIFIDASRSFVTNGRLNSIPSIELDRITKAFKEFEDIPGFCHVASPEEIRDNNFQFSISRYVPPEEAERDEINFEQIGTAITATEADLAEVRTEIDSFIQSLRIKKP